MNSLAPDRDSLFTEVTLQSWSLLLNTVLKVAKSLGFISHKSTPAVNFFPFNQKFTAEHAFQAIKTLKDATSVLVRLRIHGPQYVNERMFRHSLKGRNINSLNEDRHF